MFTSSRVDWFDPVSIALEKGLFPEYLRQTTLNGKLYIFPYVGKELVQ